MKQTIAIRFSRVKQVLDLKPTLRIIPAQAGIQSRIGKGIVNSRSGRKRLCLFDDVGHVNDTKPALRVIPA